MIGQYGTARLSSFWENSKPKENLEIKCLNDEVVHISRAPTYSVHEKNAHWLPIIFHWQVHGMNNKVLSALPFFHLPGKSCNILDFFLISNHKFIVFAVFALFLISIGLSNK